MDNNGDYEYPNYEFLLFILNAIVRAMDFEI